MAQGWTAAQIPSQSGKRAIVTGANVGLGFQTARALARAGAQVVMACRSLERGNTAAQTIRAEQPGAEIFVAQLDLSSLASVRSFAATVLDAREPVDMLINNAGIMALPQRERSVDGFEMQLATNYLGHFALTGLLLPVLLRSAAPRVVSVSSNAHKRAQLGFNDFQREQKYAAFESYSQTKLAMLVFARALQAQSELHRAKLLSLAAHPGLSATSIARKLAGPPKFIIPIVFTVLGQSDAAGALPQLYAATAPGVTPGGYYGPSGIAEFKGSPAPARASAQAVDAANGTRLWEISEQLTGVTYDWTPQG